MHSDGPEDVPGTRKRRSWEFLGRHDSYRGEQQAAEGWDGKRRGLVAINLSSSHIESVKASRTRNNGEEGPSVAGHRNFVPSNLVYTVAIKCRSDEGQALGALSAALTRETRPPESVIQPEDGR